MVELPNCLFVCPSVCLCLSAHPLRHLNRERKGDKGTTDGNQILTKGRQKNRQIDNLSVRIFVHLSVFLSVCLSVHPTVQTLNFKKEVMGNKRMTIGKQILRLLLGASGDCGRPWRYLGSCRGLWGLSGTAGSRENCRGFFTLLRLYSSGPFLSSLPWPLLGPFLGPPGSWGALKGLTSRLSVFIFQDIGSL
jgi:hypothetical protein